ncbi:uroporphyrinogen-III C-methyltransferase [Paenibacillus albicereus]|uniref:Uroporphyrinogen-III C-methyltransferase n=1 Tax=Paenibacillus albicereus TaxID=2726185 RepID=A0A6H2GZT9_9BACL|nr:uroporphyrinogen-III C-methyltransferase [Paenibacillus albicereus]QJC52953.1 uroporphyrinogen-III C-methyltransferase [Paenibacillus albicereus]
MNKGIVYLVGAGPGDPKLITVRGLELLSRSDVVVYDRLASPRLLRKLKPGAETIYVGKLPDRHTMKQEEINRLLVDLALQGKTVTRLKGGDPTIFGRVGEEAGLLAQHGIEFEIVPGITSAIAVPAYAGIPVTHRDHASSFSVITGHESPDKLDQSIDWEKVTNATGTLLFLMGVAKIGYIAAQLIRHGRPATTPVALVRWGTRPEQRTLTGTLGDIEAKVEAAGFKPPAVIVVGEVVRQRETLQWYERKPLFGCRVLVTRSRDQSSTLSDLIEELGGEPCEYPVIETVPLEGAEADAELAAALEAAAAYDWLFFTSVNGVEHFFRRLSGAGSDIRRFHRARIAAVGPKTRSALEARGLQAEALPMEFQAEGMLEHLSGLIEAGQRALIVRGTLARDTLLHDLERRGLQPDRLTVYDTRLPEQQDEYALECLREGRVHAVTFTSSSTVANLLTMLRRSGEDDPLRLLAGCEIACIGPVTARSAREAGLEPTVQPEEATIESLAAALAARMAAKRLAPAPGEAPV